MGAPLLDIFGDFEFPPLEEELNAILVEGNGPFNHADYMEFLESRGCDPRLLKKTTDLTRQYLLGKYLVVGRKNWDEERIRRLIANRAGLILKIYSQEMFLSFLLTGHDPFSDGRFALTLFARGHPALQFLSNLEYFDWPSTKVIGPIYGTSEFDWPQEGLLKHMGYSVGYYGRREQARREILKNVYESASLPQVVSKGYMDGWGEPQSALRLHKMADSIAAFCRLAKKRWDPPDLAIKDWEADLKWLYDTYYIGRYSFFWPQI